MLTLVLGGARSGKSRYARELCRRAGQVVFIATAREGDDPEMRERIARHRAERPAHWTTVEEPLAVARAVRQARPEGATVLVDCVTVWLASLTWEHRESEEGEREQAILEEVADFSRATREREVIAVSNEVGSGIVPEHPLGRAFRDLQGLVNQRLAEEAAGVVLLVAGLPLVLKGR